MRNYIYVYMKEPEVTVLGPGKRYVLWVQGCHKNCEGCVADNAKDMENGKQISIDALAYEIILSKAEGITISGGEPFLQAEELAEMLSKIKKKRDIGVIIYSGYQYEELIKKPETQKLLAQTDLLIDGPYVKELDDGKSLRGSSNQRTIYLTQRYKINASEYGVQGRKNENFYHGIYVHKIGIPENKR